MLSEFGFFSKGHIDQRFSKADKNKDDSVDLAEIDAILKGVIDKL